VAGDADRVVIARLGFGEDGREIREIKARFVGIPAGAVAGDAGGSSEVALGTDTIALMGVEFFGIDDGAFACGGEVAGGVAVAALTADAGGDVEGDRIEGSGVAVEAAWFDDAGEIQLRTALEAGRELVLPGLRVVRDRGLKEAVSLFEKKAVADAAGADGEGKLAEAFELVWLGKLEKKAWGDGEGGLCDWVEEGL